MSKSPSTPVRYDGARSSRQPAWDNVDQDDSVELTLPEFHFPWLGDNTTTAGAAAAATPLSTTAVALVSREGRENRAKAHPTAAHQRLESSSVNSSASSSHRLPLSDNSMASGSSFTSPPSAAPTPPSDYHSDYRKTASRESPPAPRYSDEAEPGRPMRPSASRSFQRVVSAPVSGSAFFDHADDDDDHDQYNDPAHQLKKSEDQRSGPADHVRVSAPRSANMVTPGIAQRTLGSSTASSRRLAGLSRFGGPARRVVAPLDPDELEEDGVSSATESPHNASDLHQPDTSSHQPTGSSSSTARPFEHVPSTYAIPESHPSLYEMPRPLDTKDLWQEPPLGLDELRRPKSPPLSTSDRGNRPLPPPQHDVGGKRKGDLALGHDERQVGNGLQDAVSVRVASVSRPPAQGQLRASRPAPSIQPSVDRPSASSPAPRPGEQLATFTAQLPPSGHGVPPSLPHVATAPAPAMPVAQPLPAAPLSKRSFLVNGVPYERLGILGKGGTSKVYSVLCPTKRVVYALKRVALDRADSETYQSYTNEIELLRRLRGHDRIIQLIDHQITFNQSNRPKMLMMVMECGEIDFAGLLDEQRGRPLNMNFVGLYWQQMLEAVQAVHAENVVHTDLKPANFVLVKGRLKIIDFGIAKAVANDTVNIQRDQQIGTVNYMSPEAIQRMNNQKVLKLSYPSDVWSLGCILYQMIYGSLPFQHVQGGPLSRMNAIADPTYRIDYPSAAVSKPSTANGQAYTVTVPPLAISAMRSCLEYDKERRLTIPQQLRHPFLSSSQDAAAAPALPPGATSITRDQMAMLVNFVLRENRLPSLGPHDSTAEDLFAQLQAQNSISQT